MLSSFTSWLTGGSNVDKSEGEADQDKTISEKAKENISEAQSEGEATGTSWTGEICVDKQTFYSIEAYSVLMQQCGRAGLISSVSGYATSIKDTVTETVKTKVSQLQVLMISCTCICMWDRLLIGV